MPLFVGVWVVCANNTNNPFFRSRKESLAGRPSGGLRLPRGPPPCISHALPIAASGFAWTRCSVGGGVKVQWRGIRTQSSTLVDALERRRVAMFFPPPGGGSSALPEARGIPLRTPFLFSCIGWNLAFHGAYRTNCGTPAAVRPAYVLGGGFRLIKVLFF